MKAKRLGLLIIGLLVMACLPVLAQSGISVDNTANYKTALSLYNTDKPGDGIPFLESILKTNSTLKPAVYDLLGNIYDKTNQPDKAIGAYLEGIKLDPNYQNLRFNLGLAYFRAKKYADAELSAIEAIKLDTKHANSQRLYGLVTFHQNKRLNALLAFCSFILLDPNGTRANEAYTNIQSILKGGVLNPAEVVPATDKNTIALNNGLAAIIAAGKTKKLPPAELLEYQLKSIFIMAGQFSAKQPTKDFFDNYYADYFYKLAQSSNMSAFAKMITEHTPLSGELESWVKGAERGF